MSRRRRVLLWAGLLVLLAGAGGFACDTWLGSPINQANCDRIRPGMTDAQVETILGSPGKRVRFDTEEQLKQFWAAWADSQVEIPGGAEVVKWQGSRSEIVAVFDRDGRVIEADFSQVEWDDAPFVRFRRWLGF